MADSLAAHKLAKWRENQGLSQGEAAKLFGITQPMLSEYETGKKIPRTLQALKIKDLTGGEVPVEAWAEDPPQPEPKSDPDSTDPQGTPDSVRNGGDDTDTEPPPEVKAKGANAA